jgi:hypothetical protein
MILILGARVAIVVDGKEWKWLVAQSIEWLEVKQVIT